MTPEQLQAKLALLARTLEQLRALPTESLETFRADDRNLDAAIRRLQVCIQILIDIGSHLVAASGLGAPESSRDVLERLERAGKLPPGSSVRFGSIFGFRNRVVHLYERIDDAIVFGLLTQRLGDLEELARLYLGALPS